MDNLNILPRNILEYIATYLDILSIGKLAQTSTHWNELTEIISTLILQEIKSKYFHQRIFKTFIKPYKSTERTVLYQLLRSKILIVRGFVAYMFYPQQRIWQRCSDLRRDRSYFQMIWLKGEIYSLGTYSLIASGTAERYNPVSNVWTSIDPLPYKVRSFSSCVWNDEILFVIGGQDVFSNDISPFIFTFKSIDDISSNSRTCQNTWKIHSGKLQRPRYGHTSIVYQHKIWILGGCYRDNQCTNDVYIWNPLLNSGTVGPRMLKNRKYFNLFIIHNILYAVGGDVHDDNNNVHDNHLIQNIENTSSTIERLVISNNNTSENISESNWEIITTFPFSRIGYCSCTYRDFIYIFGGNVNGRNNWDCYNVITNVWESSQSTLKRDMPAISFNGQAITFPPENITWGH